MEEQLRLPPVTAGHRTVELAVTVLRSESSRSSSTVAPASTASPAPPASLPSWRISTSFPLTFLLQQVESHWWRTHALPHLNQNQGKIRKMVRRSVKVPWTFQKQSQAAAMIARSPASHASLLSQQTIFWTVTLPHLLGEEQVFCHWRVSMLPQDPLLDKPWA